MVFVIHWHESALDIHVFPILIPPPTSLSTRSLWVFPLIYFKLITNLTGEVSANQDIKQLVPNHSLFHCCSVTKSLSDSLQTPWTAAHQASLSFTISEFVQTHVHWVGDAIQPSHPVVPFSLALNLSQHQDIFQQVVSSHQVAKGWSFSFSFIISSSKEYSGLISFMDLDTMIRFLNVEF